MGLMADIRSSFATWIAPPPSSTTVRPPIRASSGNPYESASTGRRAYGWNPNRLGPTTNLWMSLDIIRARARDAVRNNPWATSAIDNFEAQIIGNGIRVHWNMEDAGLKAEVEEKFQEWAESTFADQSSLLNFYGLQALACREIFEGGEVLARLYSRPTSFDTPVGLQIQLIEGEQMPVWRNITTGGSGAAIDVPAENIVRTGIEFDPQGRRIAYHLYKENPGETMLYPFNALQFIRVPAEDMLHCYKPLRAGQLRGQPFLAPVLGLLLEIDQYTDAALVKKKIQTMFAAFIENPDPDNSLLPSPLDSASANDSLPLSSNVDSGVEEVKLEAGTSQELAPGQKVIFPTLPSETDFEMFMKVQLHKFCTGVGMTYEQLTGDLAGVTFSSIRAGLLDFRRRAEQFQRNTIVQQFVTPIVRRWMREAMLSGYIALPGYAKNSRKYTKISYSAPGWPWVQPLDEARAALLEVRGGFNSREAIIAERGADVATVDARQAADKKRADSLGLVYDTDPSKVDQKGLDNTAVPASSKSQDELDSASKKPSLVKRS